MIKKYIKLGRDIEFDDPTDVKMATLARENGETIDLKEKLTDKGKKYTVTESGVYRLYAEDYNGNSVTIKFIIINK